MVKARPLATQAPAHGLHRKYKPWRRGKAHEAAAAKKQRQPPPAEPAHHAPPEERGERIIKEPAPAGRTDASSNKKKPASASSSLKHQLRGCQRLLAKKQQEIQSSSTTLTAEERQRYQEQEAVLLAKIRTLQATMATKQAVEQTRQYAKKSHGTRFLERQKLVRQWRRYTHPPAAEPANTPQRPEPGEGPSSPGAKRPRNRASLDPNHDDDGEEMDLANEVDTSQRQRRRICIILNQLYVAHYPFDKVGRYRPLFQQHKDPRRREREWTRRAETRRLILQHLHDQQQSQQPREPSSTATATKTTTSPSPNWQASWISPENYDEILQSFSEWSVELEREYFGAGTSDGQGRSHDGDDLEEDVEEMKNDPRFVVSESAQVLIEAAQKAENLVDDEEATESDDDQVESEEEEGETFKPPTATGRKRRRGDQDDDDDNMENDVSSEEADPLTARVRRIEPSLHSNLNHVVKNRNGERGLDLPDVRHVDKRESSEHDDDDNDDDDDIDDDDDDDNNNNDDDNDDSDNDDDDDDDDDDNDDDDDFEDEEENNNDGRAKSNENSLYQASEGKTGSASSASATLLDKTDGIDNEEVDDFLVEVEQVKDHVHVFQQAKQYVPSLDQVKGDKSKGWATQRQRPGQYKRGERGRRPFKR